jgi:hypothetical protein
LLTGSMLDAVANCKPRRPLPRIVLKSMGPCGFDPERASFAGEPVEQAKCLLRAFDRTRNIGPALEALPPGLESRVGRTSGLPQRQALARLLVELELLWDYAPFLWTPLSRARDNDPAAAQARYFVIHDTSGPYFGLRPFPADIDENRRLNNLARFRCGDGWAVAHVVINRRGEMMLGKELSQPWRATKFERATQFGTDLRGLFLHIELIQPRRRAGGRRSRNDAQAPEPGFSAAQYDRLALVYVIASVRADRWLIPAFHGPIDYGIRGGHDDPQNFDLSAFATSIGRLVSRLMQPMPTALVVAYGPAPAEAAAAVGPTQTAAKQTERAKTASTVRPKRSARRLRGWTRPKLKRRRSVRLYR